MFAARLILLFLLPLLALSGCERCAQPRKAAEEAKPVAVIPEKKPVEINLEETKLAVIPDGYDKWDNVTFSSDGGQVFYTARKRADEFIVVARAGGETIGPSYRSVSFLAKSLDGRRFAFGGATGEKKRLVVDNKELKYLHHEEVAPGAFSPDGRFVASDVGSFKEKKWFMSVSDGEKEVYRSPLYADTYRQPFFSPDGRLLVYELGDDSETRNNKRTIFFYDLAAKKIIKKRACTGCMPGRISFSSNSSRAVYSVQDKDKNAFVLLDFALDEEREVSLPYASAGQFVLSPDGNEIAAVAIKEERHFLVVSSWGTPTKWVEYGPYEAIVPPLFTADSVSVACLALKGGKWRIIVGEKAGPEYDGGDAPVFSPDGSKIAHAVNRGGQMGRRGIEGGKWHMVVAPVDNPAKVVEGPAYDMVVTPVFSPDGKYIAYRARTGSMENAKRFIVVADAITGRVIKEGPVSDEVWPPVWSADGKTAGYGVRIGRELWWKVESVPFATAN